MCNLAIFAFPIPGRELSQIFCLNIYIDKMASCYSYVSLTNMYSFDICISHTSN